MADTFRFMSESPFLTFFLALIIASILKAPFYVTKRWIRHLDIKAHGWPVAPMDADGDIIRNKDDEA